MRTLKTLKLGQMGTRDLLTRYGPSLLCVRYRYDDDTRDGRVGRPSALARKRGKVPWIAEARRSSWERCETEGRSLDRLGETDLRRWGHKFAGGRWDPVRRVRRLPRDLAEGPDLLSRVVGGGG